MHCSKETEVVVKRVKKTLMRISVRIDTFLPLLQKAERSIILNWLAPGAAKGAVEIAAKTKKDIDDLVHIQCGGP